jgi:hypothetical protein
MSSRRILAILMQVCLLMSVALGVFFLMRGGGSVSLLGKLTLEQGLVFLVLVLDGVGAMLLFAIAPFLRDARVTLEELNALERAHG